MDHPVGQHDAELVLGGGDDVSGRGLAEASGWQFNKLFGLGVTFWGHFWAIFWADTTLLGGNM